MSETDAFAGHSMGREYGTERPPRTDDIDAGLVNEERGHQSLIAFLDGELKKCERSHGPLDEHIFVQADGQYAIRLGSPDSYVTLTAPNVEQLYLTVEQFLAAS